MKASFQSHFGGCILQKIEIVWILLSAIFILATDGRDVLATYTINWNMISTDVFATVPCGATYAQRIMRLLYSVNQVHLTDLGVYSRR